MPPLRLAHRGDWRRAPENTLPALLAALAIPACDGLEFDVRIAADGVPVLLHDESLARVQGRPERVGELPGDALEALGVPSLARVLAALPSHTFLDVELKGHQDGSVVEILGAARDAGVGQTVVSSFEPDTLEAVARRAAGWPLWLNAVDSEPTTLRLAVELHCSGVSVPWDAVDAAAMARASKAGLEVAAWTVRRRSTYARLAALGVVAVCVEAAALDG